MCGSTKRDLAESSQAQNTYRGRVGEGGRGGFSVTVTLYLMVYPYRWSVCGSTKSDLAESSQALQSEAALSAATTSSPGGSGAFF